MGWVFLMSEALLYGRTYTVSRGGGSWCAISTATAPVLLIIESTLKVVSIT